MLIKIQWKGEVQNKAFCNKTHPLTHAKLYSSHQLGSHTNLLGLKKLINEYCSYHISIWFVEEAVAHADKELMMHKGMDAMDK